MVEVKNHYYEVNRRNAERLNLDADAVLIHATQPAPSEGLNK